MCTRSSMAGEPELECGHQWVQVLSTMQLFVRSAGASVNRIGVREHWVQCDRLQDWRVQALMGLASASVDGIGGRKHWWDWWAQALSVMQSFAGSVGVSVDRISGRWTEVLVRSVDAITGRISDTGGRGGITQGVIFEFFESFLLTYSHNTHWANFEFFQKLLTTLIKTYSLGNFRNWAKKALHLAQQVILSKNPEVLSWIFSKFAHNVPNHLLNGFFESLLKNWTKLRVFFE